MKKLLIIFILILAFQIEEVDASIYVDGIEEGYEGTFMEVEISSAYQLYVDGERYESGTKYDVVGHHVLSVYIGSTKLEDINFTIHPHFGPNITNFKQTVFNNELILAQENSGRINVFVNLKQTTLPATFNVVGDYNVLVFGANGYVREYNFTVQDSKIQNLVAGEINTRFSLNPENYVELEINGEIITEEFQFDTYGFYYVRTVGVGGYEQFRVLYCPIPDATIENRNYLEITLSPEHALEVYVNGTLLEDEIDIEDIGYYTISYKGLNGYYREYDIAIVEPQIRLDQGEIKKDIKFKEFNGDLFLNGEEYTPNTTIDVIGDYVFVIKGVNGYESEYHFSIRHDLPIADGEVLKVPTDLNINAKGLLVNGIQVDSGYRIHETGTYTINIIGEGSYNQTLTVSYTNPNDPYIPYFNIVAYSLAGVMAVTYAIILWRRSR